MIISVGPLLQTHLLTTMNSDAPTLYDAMYGNAVVHFPDLSEYLSLGLTPPYLLLGLVVAHFALRAGRLRNVVALSAILTAALLTVADLIASLAPGELTASTMVLNASANVGGSLLVAFVVGLVLPIYRWAHEAFPEAGALTDYASAVIVTGIGVLISALAYLLITYLYEPVEVRFTAVVDPPVAGDLIPKQADPSAAGPAAIKGFDFLPDNSTKGSASITSPGGLPEVTWAASAPIRYDLGLRLLGSCYKADLTKLLGSSAFISRRDVRKVVVRFDEGHSLFQVQPADNGKFQFEQEYPRAYWFKREGDGSYEVSYFVSQSGVFTAESPGQMHILAGVLLMEQKEPGKAVMGSRAWEILIDGERIPLRFKYSRGRAAGSCRPIRLPVRPRAGSAVESPAKEAVAVSSAEVSLLITLTPRERSDGLYDVRASRVSLTNANGWLAVGGLSGEEIARTEVGEASFLTLRGKPASVEADGKIIAANEFDTFIALGEMTGDVLEGGHVRIRGKAPSLWKGDTRLNPTKWERLPQEFRFTILGSLVLFLWGLLRVAWWPAMKRFRNENVNDWVA